MNKFKVVKSWPSGPNIGVIFIKDTFHNYCFSSAGESYPTNVVESSPEFFAPLLFMSHDNVEIYDGDTYWLKCTDNRIVEECPRVNNYMYKDGALVQGQLTFSTCEAAQRWIDAQNKPKFVEREWLFYKDSCGEEWLFRFKEYRNNGGLIHNESYHINSKTNELYENKSGWFMKENVVTADVDTIQRILSMVAISKGFKEGVTYTSPVFKYKETCDGKFNYYPRLDTLSSNKKRTQIYNKGVWAEILSEEIPEYVECVTSPYPEYFTVGKIYEWPNPTDDEGDVRKTAISLGCYTFKPSTKEAFDLQQFKDNSKQVIIAVPGKVTSISSWGSEVKINYQVK